MKRSTSASSSLLLALSTASAAAFAAGPYLLQDIGQPFPIGPAPLVTPTAINNSGQVAGVLDMEPVLHTSYSGFSWQNGVFTVVPGSLMRPTDVNDSGLVVGYEYQYGSGTNVPFTWRVGDATTVMLPPVGNVSDHQRLDAAMGVNTAGVVVGKCAVTTGGGPGDAGGVKWVNGVPSLVGAGVATAVNDSGAIAGQSPTGDRPGYYAPDGTPTPIGSAAGTALDLNSAGRTVGVFGGAYFNSIRGPGFKGLVTSGTPFQYDAMTDVTQPLNLLAGFDRGQPQAINDRNEIVGRLHSSQATNDDIRLSEAVIWENGQPQLLDQLLVGNNDVNLYIANDINDSGLIVAYGQYVTQTNPSAFYGFVLTPVPEPVSVSLPLACVAWIAARRRRAA